MLTKSQLETADSIYRHITSTDTGLVSVIKAHALRRASHQAREVLESEKRLIRERIADKRRKLREELSLPVHGDATGLFAKNCTIEDVAGRPHDVRLTTTYTVAGRHLTGVYRKSRKKVTVSQEDDGRYYFDGGWVSTGRSRIETYEVEVDWYEFESGDMFFPDVPDEAIEERYAKFLSEVSPRIEEIDREIEGKEVLRPGEGMEIMNSHISSIYEKIDEAGMVFDKSGDRWSVAEIIRQSIERDCEPTWLTTHVGW